MNLNFWLLYFYNSIFILQLCLYTLKFTKSFTVHFKDILFYLWINLMQLELVLTYILNVWYKNTKFMLKTSSNLIIFSYIINSFWFLFYFVQFEFKIQFGTPLTYMLLCLKRIFSLLATKSNLLTWIHY